MSEKKNLLKCQKLNFYNIFKINLYKNKNFNIFFYFFLILRSKYFRKYSRSEVVNGIKKKYVEDNGSNL